MRVSRSLLMLLASLLLGACGAPKLITPYRMDIQQGNYLSQEAVSQLKAGMTREQVRFLLGSPLVTDMFHSERWDYVYYRDTAGGGRQERKLTVIFADGRLARVLGDVVPASPAGADERKTASPAAKPAAAGESATGAPAAAPAGEKKP